MRPPDPPRGPRGPSRSPRRVVALVVSFGALRLHEARAAWRRRRSHEPPPAVERIPAFDPTIPRGQTSYGPRERRRH